MVNYANICDAAWRQLLAGFGEPDDVAREVEGYLREAPQGMSAVAVYSKLVDARVKHDEVDPARGKLLKEAFEESFAPDPITGYFPKHRLPLIEAVLQAGRRVHPEQQTFIVQADVMNLGGLNRDLGEKNRYSNGILAQMARMLHDGLKGQGEVTAIRQGGDELSLLVTPKAGCDQKTIEAACADAQKRVAELILKAGLRNCAHTKPPKPPGVGIGVAIAPYAGFGDVAMQQALEAGIDKSKERFQLLLGTTKSDAPLASKQSAAAGLSYVGFKGIHPPHKRPMEPVGANVGSEPRYLPRIQLAARLRRVGERALSTTERNLINATADAGQAIDYVTGLPLYGAVDQYIIPNFTARHGTPARLVHIDFNNLGGANKLGSWVGDAMAKLLGEVVQKSMYLAHLEDYIPYLTAQGGGRFALMLPREIENEPAAMINKLHDMIDIQLYKHRAVPLDLTEDQVIASHALMRKSAAEQIRKHGANVLEERRGVSLALSSPVITLEQIDGVKSRRQGSNVVVNHAMCHLEHFNADRAIRPLELRAGHYQKAVADHHEVKWAERHLGRNSATRMEEIKAEKSHRKSVLERMDARNKENDLPYTPSTDAKASAPRGRVHRVTPPSSSR